MRGCGIVAVWLGTHCKTSFTISSVFLCVGAVGVSRCRCKGKFAGTVHFGVVAVAVEEVHCISLWCELMYVGCGGGWWRLRLGFGGGGTLPGVVRVERWW